MDIAILIEQMEILSKNQIRSIAGESVMCSGMTRYSNVMNKAAINFKLCTKIHESFDFYKEVILRILELWLNMTESKTLEVESETELAILLCAVNNVRVHPPVFLFEKTSTISLFQTLSLDKDWTLGWIPGLARNLLNSSNE